MKSGSEVFFTIRMSVASALTWWGLASSLGEKAGDATSSHGANFPSFPREYCRRVLRKSHSDCSAYTLSFDTSIFVIESARRRVAVEATLENRGENAYNTILNISFSRNLQFASLIQKVRDPCVLSNRV